MPRRPPHRAERGAALLVAIVAVAVLTALAVDLAYETSVRLRTAANARDELRAEAMAQSAVTMARLTISFQAGVDNVSTGMCNALNGGGGGTPTAACPRLQVWNLIPVSSGLTQSLFGDAGKGPAAEAKPASAEQGSQKMSTATYGDFEGGFEAKIEDESQKINVQLDALQTSGVLGPQVEALLRMMCEAKWDGFFDRTDADGQRYSRTDLVRNLRDWVTSETTASSLTASFPGGNCSFVVPPNPFEKAFSDKNYAYDRGPDRYKTKNARLDSVAELSLVAGVTDNWMGAFEDQLTAYLPVESGMNVNTNDPVQQLRIAALMTDQASVARLLDPSFQSLLGKTLNQLRMGGLLTISPVQFAQALQALGMTVRPEYLTQNPKNPFTDKTLVFRIRALGVAGDVTHETEVVVSYDPNLVPLSERPKPGQGPSLLPSLGQLVRWHEE
jgi:general secretion pathway protein K